MGVRGESMWRRSRVDGPHPGPRMSRTRRGRAPRIPNDESRRVVITTGASISVVVPGDIAYTHRHHL